MNARDHGPNFYVYVTRDELHQHGLEGDSLTFLFSKTDGRVLQVTPQEVAQRFEGKLSALAIEARECGAITLGTAGHLKLSRLAREYLEHCRRNPGTIVLVRMREGYEALMKNAITAATALRLPLKSRTNYPMCCIPENQLDSARAKLGELGHPTVVVEYESKSR